MYNNYKLCIASIYAYRIWFMNYVSSKLDATYFIVPDEDAKDWKYLVINLMWRNVSVHFRSIRIRVHSSFPDDLGYPDTNYYVARIAYEAYKMHTYLTDVVERSNNVIKYED